MAEKVVGLIQDVLLGPWFGEVYDLLMTDQRFLLLFVEKFTMKSKLDARDISCYEKESMDVLASREKTSSIPYSAVKKIHQKHGAEGGWHILILRYENDKGKAEKTKLMLTPLDIPRMRLMAVKDMKNKLVPVSMDYPEGIELLLSKAMPGISL